jgi:two-component system, chemotaxis family, chemotaxis protein CheY
MHSLVVEDDVISRRILCSILEKYGSCDFAEDGVAGVAAAEKALADGTPYDLICLDIMMPNLDGQQALGQIRQLEQEAGMVGTEKARVFMVSAAFDERNVLERIEDWDAYIVKPIDQRQIINELERFNLV